ncbi:MAG: hypothetical protein ACLP9L_09990 [Thermoguttaceae bacterium]
MTRQHLKYLKNEAIEDITAQRIREYEAKVEVTVTLPVPIEEIVEQVLGLDFDWDKIEEQPGEQILGGMDVANRKILINETHSDLFDEKPGLLRSTIERAFLPALVDAFLFCDFDSGSLPLGPEFQLDLGQAEQYGSNHSTNRAAQINLLGDDDDP